MAAKQVMKLSIVTPHSQFHYEDGDLVVLTTKDGERGFEREAEATLLPLIPGALRYRKEEGNGQVSWRNFFASTGYAEVGPEQVTVVVSAAEPAAEIDVARAQQALQRARERASAENASSRDIVHGRHAERRALARLRVARLYADRN